MKRQVIHALQKILLANLSKMGLNQHYKSVSSVLRPSCLAIVSDSVSDQIL